MNKQTCETCNYYIQHYKLEEDRCAAVNCGHCTYPRLKHRKPLTEACIHYVPRLSPPALPDRKKVIDYLTTDILQHILRYELPPVIAEMEEGEGSD